MTTDLLFTIHSGKGVAAKVMLDHGAMKPDDYVRLYAAFAKLVGGKAEFIEMHTLYKDNYRWGVWWAEYNCPDGCRFTLMVEPMTGHETYLAVRRHLKQQRDVKSFKTLKIHKWVNLQNYANHQTSKHGRSCPHDEGAVAIRTNQSDVPGPRTQTADQQG